MPTPFKTAAVALALACLAVPALAQSGPGDMLLDQFDAIDGDKDGSISPAEIAAHRLARFADSDTNGDGLLSAEELSAAHIARITEQASSRTAEMLRWLDGNGDGQLSIEEMPDGPSPRRLARLDANDDGLISRDEAEAAIERHGKGFRQHRKGTSPQD